MPMNRSSFSTKLTQIVLVCVVALTAACAGKQTPVRGAGRPVMRRPRPSMMASTAQPRPAPAPLPITRL
jgi:hypothetical protein